MTEALTAPQEAHEAVPGAEPVSEPLAARKAALEARLAPLRGRITADILAGLAVDTSEVKTLEYELEAIIEAEAEQRRRERAEEAAATLARRSEAMGEVGRLERERLAAIEEAEGMARAMVAAMGRAENARSKMVPMLRAWGIAAPIDLEPGPAIKRLSWRLSAALAGVPGAHPGRFGDMELRHDPNPQARASDAWTAGEARTTADLNTLMKGSNDGN